MKASAAGKSLKGHIDYMRPTRVGGIAPGYRFDYAGRETRFVILVAGEVRVVGFLGIVVRPLPEGSPELESDLRAIPG